MNFIIALLYFVLTNSFPVLLFKKKFGKCIPLTLFLSAFVLFFSQVLFKTFQIGFITLLIIPLLSILLLFKERKNKENFNLFKNNYFSSGFYAFITLCLMIFIFDYNRHFTMWDEFSHWGVMVKEMIRLDNFYSIDLSTLMAHKDYPPIIQLFELFCVKLCGGYSENYVISSLHLLQFSLLIPFIELVNDKNKIDKKKIVIRTIFTILITYLTLLLFDQHNAINSIYVDYCMAMIVSYVLASIIIEKESMNTFNLINLCVAMSFLLLTKQIALTLYLMALVLFIVNELLKTKFHISFNKKMLINSIKVIVLLIVIPLLIWKGWNGYVEKLNVDQQFKLSDLKLSELKNIIQGTSGEKWQYEASHNYYKAIKTRNMTTSPNIQLSYLQCILLTVVLLYLVWKYGKEVFKKGQIPLLTIILLCGYIGYAFVMLVMYTFSFGPYEGPNLASFDRYMPTYIIICMILIIMLLLFVDSYKEQKKIKNKYYIIIFVVISLLQSPAKYSYIMPQLINHYDKKFEDHAINIKKGVNDNSKVFIIAEGSVGEYQYYVKYYLDSITTNLEYFSLPFDDEEITDYEYYFNDKVKDYMLKYDYLYLAIVNDEFNEKYSFLFDETPKAGNLYKISNVNDKIILELID